jgi:uncharacterized membrane protein YhaH (DUF805 family)
MVALSTFRLAGQDGGEAMEHGSDGGLISLVVVLVGAVLFGVPAAMIVRKVGYSPWWALLWFVPLVNLIMLWVFALSRWPIEEQLRGRN